MIKRKENKIVGLTACILAIVLVCGVVQAQPIPVPNFSFELDESGDQIPVYDNDYDLNDSLGWNRLEQIERNRPLLRREVAPVSPYIPDGEAYLLMKQETYNALSLVWQILDGVTISEGDTYLLTFNVTKHYATSVADVVATLVYDDDGATLGGATLHGETFVPTTSGNDGGDGTGEPWDEFMVHFTVPAGAPCINKHIGIKFEQTIRDWAQVDNVRLELNPDINFPPVVAAGGVNSFLVNTLEQLNANVIDDGNPAPPSSLTYAWSQLSGPATAAFSPNPNVEDPCVSFPAVGVYELQLSVSDSVLDACDVLMVHVRATDDPIAHWDFENDGTGTGTNVVDRTVNDNFGTFAGDPEPNWVPGWVGDWALDVADGSYVAITVDPAPDPNLNTMYGAVTVSAWVKVDEWMSSSWDGIVTKGDGGAGGAGGWSLIRNSSNDTLTFFAPDAGRVDGSVNVKDGYWHHVVGVHNGTTISLYVDGLPDGSAEASGIVKPNTAEVWINGNSEVADRFFDGEIDDVRIYNYGMDIDGVQALTAMGALIPVVDAGEDQVFSMQGGFVQLDGTVTDDGEPAAATLEWTQESGPGTAEFSNDAIEDPTVTFSEVGEYILRLTADDVISQIYDEVTITVESPICQNVIDDGLLLPADLSGPEGVPDCYVDLYDVAEFASYWLRCNDPQDSECEFPY